MKANKLVIVLLAIVLALSITACSQKETTKDGHITLQYIYYETASGALFYEEESLGIDHFELNGNTFRRPPYNIYNLPGNQFYDYTIKAYDAEGTLMASGSGQWMVVEGFTTPQTATLTVRHQHTFKDTWSSDATYHWHGSSCGHSAINDKTQHTFDGDICTVCGYDKHVHTYSSSWSSDNYSHWHAANCGHNLTKDSASHSFGAETIITEPTCSKSGKGNHTCTVCGKTISYSIPKKEHISSGDDTVVTEPSCLEGEGTYTCGNCGETITFTIPATGVHQFNDDQVCTICGFHETTGMYVFYDKGSYSDGWRYLEAAPADLRVVNGAPTVDSTVSGYSSASTEYIFGYYRTSDSGGDLFVNGTTKYNSSDCTGTAIGTGKSNTQMLVSAMGSETYSKSSGSSKTANYAARLCDILTYTVGGVVYDDWFLPSIDELNLMYTNLHMKGLGHFGDYYTYWSSSESSSGTHGAWKQYFNDGNQLSSNQINSFRVRPVRAF